MQARLAELQKRKGRKTAKTGTTTVADSKEEQEIGIHALIPKPHSKFTIHNTQSLLAYRGVRHLEWPWEKLTTKKVQSFLSDVRVRDVLSVDRRELESEVNEITCERCRALLMDTIDRVFETACLSIAPSIKAARPPPQTWNHHDQDHLVLGCSLNLAQIGQLKELALVQEKSEAVFSWVEGGGKNVGDTRGVVELKEEEGATADFIFKDRLSQQEHFRISGFSKARELLHEPDELHHRLMGLSGVLQRVLEQDEDKTSGSSWPQQTASQRSLPTILSNYETYFRAYCKSITTVITKLFKLWAAADAMPPEECDHFSHNVTGLHRFYEKTCDDLLEATIKGRKEILKDAALHGSQNHHLLQLLGTPASQKTKLLQARAVLEKHRLVEQFQDYLSKLFQDGSRMRSILEERYRLADQLDECFSTQHWIELDKHEEAVLDGRHKFIVELCTANSRQEHVQLQQSIDAEIKAILTQWDDLFTKAWKDIEEVAQERLGLTRYPQTSAMMRDWQAREETNLQDLRQQQEDYELQAKLSQAQVEKLSGDIHQRKVQLKTVSERERKESGKVAKNGEKKQFERELEAANVQGVMLLNADDEESEERSQLVTVIQDVQHHQLDACIRFRFFATKNYIHRQNILRRYHSLLSFAEYRRPRLAEALCGGQDAAERKMREMIARRILGKLWQATLTWQAEIVEKELMAGEERESLKQKKRSAKRELQLQQQAGKQGLGSRPAVAIQPTAEIPEAETSLVNGDWDTSFDVRSSDSREEWQGPEELGSLQESGEEGHEGDCWTTVSIGRDGDRGRRRNGVASRREQLGISSENHTHPESVPIVQKADGKRLKNSHAAVRAHRIPRRRDRFRQTEMRRSGGQGHEWRPTDYVAPSVETGSPGLKVIGDEAQNLPQQQSSYAPTTPQPKALLLERREHREKPPQGRPDRGQKKGTHASAGKTLSELRQPVKADGSRPAHENIPAAHLEQPSAEARQLHAFPRYLVQDHTQLELPPPDIHKAEEITSGERLVQLEKEGQDSPVRSIGEVSEIDVATNDRQVNGAGAKAMKERQLGQRPLTLKEDAYELDLGDDDLCFGTLGPAVRTPQGKKGSSLPIRFGCWEMRQTPLSDDEALPTEPLQSAEFPAEPESSDQAAAYHLQTTEETARLAPFEDYPLESTAAETNRYPDSGAAGSSPPMPDALETSSTCEPQVPRSSPGQSPESSHTEPFGQSAAPVVRSVAVDQCPYPYPMPIYAASSPYYPYHDQQQTPCTYPPPYMPNGDGQIYETPNGPMTAFMSSSVRRARPAYVNPAYAGRTRPFLPEGGAPHVSNMSGAFGPLPGGHYPFAPYQLPAYPCPRNFPVYQAPFYVQPSAGGGRIGINGGLQDYTGYEGRGGGPRALYPRGSRKQRKSTALSDERGYGSLPASPIRSAEGREHEALGTSSPGKYSSRQDDWGSQSAPSPALRGQVEDHTPKGGTENRPIVVAHHCEGDKMAGHNSCYLQVVVQALWSFGAFRERLIASSPNAESTTLETVLREALLRLSTSQQEDHSCNTHVDKVAIDGLRHALNELAGPKAKFRAGCMDDAIEAFEEILTFLVEGGGLGREAVEDTFCLHLRELIICSSCHQASPYPPNDYDTNVLYVPVRSLLQVAGHSTNQGIPDFARLLQTAGSGDLYSCMHIQSRCSMARRGDKQASRRYLLHGAPQVFCVGLVWDNLRGDSSEISSVLSLISPDLPMASFRLPSPMASDPGGEIGNLCALFAFQPSKHHYVAFLQHEHEWACMDDGDIQTLGRDFAGVLSKCAQQAYQPSLLFYEISCRESRETVTASQSDLHPAAK